MNKKPSKKNIEKLKQYFLKNELNAKPDNRKNKNTGTKPLPNQ